MSEFEHQPGEDDAATPGETSNLEQRRRAIKAALIAGPFVATLSSGRALAVSEIGCSIVGSTKECGPSTPAGMQQAELQKAAENSTVVDQTTLNETSDPSSSQDQQTGQTPPPQASNLWEPQKLPASVWEALKK